MVKSAKQVLKPSKEKRKESTNVKTVKKKESKKEFTEQAEVNIGMVGHVDHGKTSLTEQLTGKWTDTHSEELKRGISIRLGYADATFYKCPKCKGGEAFGTKESCKKCGSKTKKLRKVSFVDAPGHETLMTTMLSGAALMQGAILVIAANEKCPQPRTIEHLMALKINNINNIVVAQNKIDLVDKKQAIENFKQIKKFLKEHGYSDVSIIPTAANFGTNIDLLVEAIEKSIPTPNFDLNKPMKMYCARSFDINKPGTKIEDLKGGVVGGSIIQGRIKTNDEIEISPGVKNRKIKTKVVSLSTADGRLKEAKPGGLIAIGTLVDPSITQNDRMRGQVISAVGLMPEPTNKLKLEVHFIERVITDIEKCIKINDLLVLTIGTTTAVGTVVGKKNNWIDVSLKNSVVVEVGQKIAISKREKSQWRLVAYGISK